MEDYQFCLNMPESDYLESYDLNNQFDGEVIKIRCAGALIAMPAVGEPWSCPYSLKVEHLRRLPKRLMHEIVESSIWESTLTIGNIRYPGVVAIDSEEDT